MSREYFTVEVLDQKTKKKVKVRARVDIDGEHIAQQLAQSAYNGPGHKVTSMLGAIRVTALEEK